MIILNKGTLKLLDCTLRDGGQCLESNHKHGFPTPVFTDQEKRQIAENVRDSGADIIEIGCMTETTGKNKQNIAIYENIEEISAFLPHKMYEIRTNAQTNVVLTGGKATPSSHPITVAPGWNWIGYVSNTSNSIDNALSSLTSNEDDIIQSRNAFSSYFPGYGWYGDLENMTPGQGYMYKSNGTVSQTLVYPTAVRSNESGAIVYHNQADYNRYRNVMDVMAKVIINGEPANSNRYELAAFVDGECRGRAKLQYVEPMDTYLAFITINGNEGEEIAFRLYDEDRAETYEADELNIVLFKPKVKEKYVAIASRGNSMCGVAPCTHYGIPSRVIEPLLDATSPPISEDILAYDQLPPSYKAFITPVKL